MRLLINICLILISCQGWSQQAGENYRVLTDRSIYMSGEVIHVSVFNQSADALQELDWSRVFYLELISPDGFSHSQAKITVESNGAAGALKVPDEVPSGTYYLKGYTRWMRNYGPEGYTYLSVEIINPFNRAVLSVDTSSNLTPPLVMHERNPKAKGALQGNLASRYAKRAPVHLNLSIPEDENPVNCCVTVIPQGSLKEQWESVSSSGGFYRNEIEQIPETRGISLSGKVQFAGSGNPASYAVVYISLIGEKKAFFPNYTDSAGRFYYAFPDGYGETDLYISANHSNPMELEIFIEQDFCTESIALPSYTLKTDPQRLKLISDLSLNAQIRDQYGSDLMEIDDSENPNLKFFYGKPSTIIQFDDFITLPAMEEYFAEVIPQVSIRRSNGKKQFRIMGEHPDLKFYAPLLMIDGVTIFDVESALAISPRHVDRMEIVNAPYIKGNVTFGGIINIISRNGNMGYIDLPSSGLLVNYKMYDETQPGDQLVPPEDPRLPDTRNTLYWNPHMELLPDEIQEISFQTPHMEGDYEVLIRGFNSLGVYFEKSIPFRVE